ncbi:PREDICTED: regulation of nuclear pre-mRNA domain-containing protein 2-like isoform X2 [Cyprinodon variegatus]|uniref:regulation of nuclear pre-mRNA domain-containing protein 2-like isoform X2 n=1 Tax=Cyprinodon variegatus TaxID=28743 RepID=UPI0007425624|nr:PREDICTED: regulation of nuclear pre-mRNA domain-containing protein 2-like isoform X2 [Cyprinodon variegatus]
MAAGTGGSFEASLEKRFRGLTNTMDSIQGLSAWCIDNKKYHSLIVRQWMKCLRKSNASHRLNLMYLANDVIQNCKRKNAINYRTAFAEVLPDAFQLVKLESDPKMIKSVERILSIWEERDVYSGTLVNDLRNILVKEESPPQTPVEQKTPVVSKAELQSKVVAEFVPQAFIDQLNKYKKSLEEVDLKEKQLAAMRVDIFSSDALRKLKDKAGGKKFSRDFEEGSAQLQEFVKFFEKQSKIGPALLEALGNADIFYEMQYKEVKIVANAYQTFANRVSHLKRKLDALKATLPDLDESPIPSPTADAPSPTGSESPFHGLELAHPDPDLDGSAMDDDAEPPAPSPLSSPGASPKPSEIIGEDDNREVADMELSEEEMDSGGIIVEEQNESFPQPAVSAPTPAKSEPSVATEQITQPVRPSAAVPLDVAAALPAAPPSTVLPAVSSAAPPLVPLAAPADISKNILSTVPASAPVAPLAAVPAAALENVDLGKIGSILSSLSPVIKSTAVEDHPTAPPVIPKPAPPLVPQDASSLVNLLSKVDVSPADLLSALSKVQSHSNFKGTTPLPSPNVAPHPFTSSKTTSSSLPASAAHSQSTALSIPATVHSAANTAAHQNSEAAPKTSNKASALVQALHRNMDLSTDPEPSVSSLSLDSKIHSFLQGNPAFSGFDQSFPTNPSRAGESFSPVTGTENQEGTPVRDEGGGTPTQDEMMDKTVSAALATSKNQSSVDGAAKTAPVAFENNMQRNPNNPQHPAYPLPELAQNGQVFQSFPFGKQEMLESRLPAPAEHNQHVAMHPGGPAFGAAVQSRSSISQTVEGFQRANNQSWFGDEHPERGPQQPSGFNMLMPGVRENRTAGLYPYQTEQNQEHQEFVSKQGPSVNSAFFGGALPPVPKVPPPPPSFDPMMTSPGGGLVNPPQQEPVPHTAAGGCMESRGDSFFRDHDHQHSSMHPDDLFHDPHPPPQPEDMRFHEDPGQSDGHFLHDDSYYPADEPYFSPPHPYPRGRGHIPPPRSPSRDPYFAQEHHNRPLPRQYGPRRPPPPHHEMRHPGQRPPPPRQPHLARHPNPRGPPRQPFPRFNGPDPRFRGKRPGWPGPRGDGPMFPPKRPFPPPRY